ncbi:MAG: hypothetical protein MK106_13470 [Mariniblastus sp.]|nr:hypothetical protein [Mariniblastus sp.]
MPHQKNIAGVLAFCIVFMLFPGCETKPASQSTGSRQSDALSADEILGEVLRQYRAAASYTDQAKLYLNYRIDGRSIQEPQPWSTQWVKGKGLSSRLFNCQISFDHRLLSCYVFDIDSANLDDQQWVIPASQTTQLEELFSDPIARHFLCGYSELPLDESTDTLQDSLKPPIFHLCCGLATGDWFGSNSLPKRLPDQNIDQSVCYVLGFSTSRGSHQVFINQQTGLIEQISFPLDYLDQRILQAGEIENVTLFARFHEAQLNTSLNRSGFEVKPRGDAQLVRQFVTIPEPFPCDQIGRPLPTDTLLKPDGTPFSDVMLAGKTSVFHWFDGDLKSLQQFKGLANSADDPLYRFYAVYSDSELEQPGTDSSRPSTAIASVVSPPSDSASVAMIYDPQLGASQKARLNVFPAVLVIGPDRTIQFVQGTQQPDWKKRLLAAMQRVSSGERLAEEMQTEYQQFLKQYARQILENDQSNLFNAASNSQPTDTALNPFQLERLWSLRSTNENKITASGNMISAGGNLYVLDGFQTILKIGADGVQRGPALRLNLPQGVGVTRLRKLVGPQDERTFACFSKLGPAPYLFDSEWQSLGPQPEWDRSNVRQDNTEATARGLSDCQLNYEADQGPRLFLAFTDQRGFREIPLGQRGPEDSNQSPSKTTHPLFSHQPVYALNGPDANLLLTDDPNGNRTIIDQEGNTIAPSNVTLQTLTGTPSLSIACGYDASNQWRALALTPDGKHLWNHLTHPQEFETDFENVALTDQGKLVAIADSQNQIQIFDYVGNLVACQRFQTPIRGMCWLSCELMSEEIYKQTLSEKQTLEQTELPNLLQSETEPPLEIVDRLKKKINRIADQLERVTIVGPDRYIPAGDAPSTSICLAISLGETIELWQIRPVR